jgi:hypothetical protein
MSKPRSFRNSDENVTRAEPASATPFATPFAEDLVRREKTPFIMTSVGRRAKNTFGWEAGHTMYFSPDDPS